MSVLLVTSLGDIVVDLYADKCKLTCKNFIKLCKIKYYNGCIFHTVQKDFTAQTGDPTGTGAGGDSIYKFLYGDQARFFGDEIRLDLKHTKMGTVAMASGGKDLNASQFYITLRDDLDYLDGKHTVFGEIAEGLETLQRINEAYCDEKGRPYKNIRIKHTYILDDPFDDPEQLTELIPDASPEGKPKAEVDDDVRLEDDWVPMDEQLGEQLEEVLRDKAAHSRAVVLESIGDIPDAEMKPPDNVLFVCKLNPVTEDEDLNTIFSRFGTVTSAEIIRDFKTGDSLCYAFIEFESTESCEEAYFKMDNALIDDRRIHVDFSQSVAKLWTQYRRKDSKMAKGNGCFKCGAPDHFAKDCQGDNTANQQPSKYILKDDNNQRGGGNNLRYEMVFDEDAAKSPQGEKGSRDRDQDDHIAKQQVEHRSSEEKKKNEKRDRHRQNDRGREYKEFDRDHDRRSSQSSRSLGDVKYREEPRNRDRDVEYHEETRNRDRDVEYREETSNRDKYTEKNGHGDESRRERDGQDYRKRRSESDAPSKERVGEGKRRENDDNGIRDSRDESRHKRSGHADDSKGRREERDYGKRSRDYDEGRDRERDYRKHRSDGRR